MGESIVKAPKAKLINISLKLCPIHIRLMLPMEQSPIQNMSQIQPLVQEMRIGMLRQEES